MTFHKKPLELWHLLMGLAVPIIGGVFQFGVFYSSMGRLERDVLEIRVDVKTLSEKVNQMIGENNKK